MQLHLTNNNIDDDMYVCMYGMDMDMDMDMDIQHICFKQKVSS
jgi:hypothetical protein